MSDIFISYAREDQGIARKLANALGQKGWTVWWDPHLRAGEHFDAVIEKALMSAKCVVVLWSQNSVTSQYVRDEATYALEHKKVVPVAIEAVELLELPLRFRGLHTPTLLSWDGSTDFSEFRKLSDDISAIVGYSDRNIVLNMEGTSEYLSEHEQQSSAEQASVTAKEDQVRRTGQERTSANGKDRRNQVESGRSEEEDQFLEQGQQPAEKHATWNPKDLNPNSSVPKGQLTEELFRRHPRMSRMLGWCGIATLMLGYVATALEGIADVNRHLFELFGPNRLLAIHFGMTFFIVAVFIIGYLTVAVWAYRRYLLKLENHRRRLWAGAVTACGLLLAGCSIYVALPAVPDMLAVLGKETSLWDRELLALNVDGGGLKTSRGDSAETQVWSTAQSLTGIMIGRGTGLTTTDAEQIREHLEYIERVRLPKDEGWGYFERWDWGATEIAAWVVLAYLTSTQKETVSLVWGNDSEKAFQRLDQYLKLLQGRQLAKGGWGPISQKDNEQFARTYSTTMALWALIESKKHPEFGKRIGTAYDRAIKDGIRWLLSQYDKQLNSWVPNPGRSRQTETFPGLTAQILFVLERAKPEFNDLLQVDASYEPALRKFEKSIAGDETDSSTSLATRPVGRNDRTPDSDVYLPPSKFMLEGSTFLWFPWSLALCSQITDRVTVDSDAKQSCELLVGRINELIKFAKHERHTYIMAESLLAVKLQIAGIVNQELRKATKKS